MPALVSICLLLKLLFDSLIWGIPEEYGDVHLGCCRAFLPVPGVMQTVQRVEFWGAILVMQACWPCHAGIDNLNVSRTLVGCWTRTAWLSHCSWLKMVI